jgi:thiamine pyridinylase
MEDEWEAASKVQASDSARSCLMAKITGRPVCFILIASLLLGMASCKADRDASRQVLRVALFPFIPDAAEDSFLAMAQRIEREFETAHPEVDLDLRFFEGDWGYYYVDTLANWLTADPEEDGYHVVEIDAILLGELVQRRLIATWDSLPRPSDWHALALAATQFEGSRYGIPHWLCGHFIFSRNASVIEAQTVTQLVQALNADGADELDLTGRLAGSWNLPSLYLDAWSDTYGPMDVATAVSLEFDSTTIQSLRAIAHECETSDGNPCLAGGAFDNDDHPDSSVAVFANGNADATFGYSERLHTILKLSSHDSTVQLASAPLGAGNAPIAFADAYVRRADCEAACARAAYAFGAYMKLQRRMSGS